MAGEPSDGPRIVGRWVLESWSGTDADGNVVNHGGESPAGELIYRDDGRMAVQISYDDRPSLGSRELDAGTVEQKAGAYDTYNAYAGTWRLEEPGTVVHEVEMAIHPDQPGMEKRREFTLEGDRLTLRTQPVTTGGRTASSELVWRRAGD